MLPKNRLCRRLDICRDFMGLGMMAPIGARGTQTPGKAPLAAIPTFCPLFPPRAAGFVPPHSQECFRNRFVHPNFHPFPVFLPPWILELHGGTAQESFGRGLINPNFMGFFLPEFFLLSKAFPALARGKPLPVHPSNFWETQHSRGAVIFPAVSMKAGRIHIPSGIHIQAVSPFLPGITGA